MIYADFEIILVLEEESKIQNGLMRTNIKNILLALMAMNNLLMISLVSLVRHT